MTTSNFCFATCQHGAERALKDEVAREHPDLNPAFQRPGLVTFKSASPIGPGQRLRSVFARRQGIAVGPLAGNAIPKEALVQVFSRDPAPFEIAEAAWAAARAHALAEGQRLGGSARAARVGELVADVITAPEEPTFLGLHMQRPDDAPLPGGEWPVEPMADAPNLAWKKLEETLLWSGAPIRAGQQVLQIGCAPGGASLALLRQGLNITGVDPAQMDQRVLNNRRFTWIQSEINEVAEGLPERLDWLVVDAAMTPQRLIRSVRRFGPRYKRSLQGAILHFKLTDWRFADQLPGFMADVADLGFSRVRAAQLASHRGEVVVYARR